MARIDDVHIAGVAKIFNISKEALTDMIDEEGGNKFKAFKVDQLKEALKYLKNAGYYRNKLQLSKSELIDAIESLFKGDTATNAGTVHYHAAAAAPMVVHPISFSAPSSLKVSSIVNTARKREVYMELMNVPGLTQREVLLELSACADPDPDPDTLLFMIISKRQVLFDTLKLLF